MRQFTAYTVEPLRDHHDCRTFVSGVDALDHYFRYQVGQDIRRRVAAAYVLIHSADPDRPIGYYSLSSTVVLLRDLPAEVSRRLPRYPNVPATLVGRFAVSSAHQGIGLGEYLLMDALGLSLEQSRKIASAAVVVDAKSDAAAKFFSRYGFVKFPGNPSRLFIPMATIEQLISR